MRTCASCDHVNADHLAYCFGCGRRVRPLGADPALAETLSALPANLGLLTVASSPALAATIALETLGTSPGRGGASPDGRRHTLLRGYDAARYVFVTIRGRMDAEERRRHLMQETEGARRLAEGTLVEIGQTVLAQRISHPDLDPLVAASVALRIRQQAVISDLAAAEKFQAAEDLRLGLLEASAEAEWKSCSDTARDVELTLGRNESERREAREELARHDAARVAGGATAPPGDRGALADRCTTLDAQYRALRERAAALRASSLGAKGKLEQATAARKLAAAAVAASVNGHSRERGEIDAELRRLTTQIGARAIEQRVPSTFLTPPYERFDRLQATTRAQQNELARLERSRGGIDRSRFAAGLGVILGALGMCGAGLWALLK